MKIYNTEHFKDKIIGFKDGEPILALKIYKDKKGEYMYDLKGIMVRIKEQKEIKII